MLILWKFGFNKANSNTREQRGGGSIMFKNFKALLYALLIILTFVGCSNGDGLIFTPKEVTNVKTVALPAKEMNVRNQPITSPVVTSSPSPASLSSAEDTMQVLVGQKVLDSVVTNILNAKKSIDMDMYEFTNTKIMAALVKAHENGVKERIVLDVSSTKTAGELKKHGIDVHIETVKGAINHVKLLEVDDSKVLLGSVNFGSGSGKNEDASVWMPVTKDVTAYFDSVWSGKQPMLKGSVLYNGIETQIEALSLISNAKKSIVVGMFAWTDMKTVDAIIKASEKGINVTLYIDGHQKENEGVIKKFKDAKLKVILAKSRQWLHLKGLVVDDQITLMGSANWSYNGFHKNHELNFVTSSPAVAKGINELLAQTKTGS
jgi:phosphatidylserine/phosphatidylglycerophosphate/cardiolipin synthase-like enzyme